MSMWKQEHSSLWWPLMLILVQITVMALFTLSRLDRIIELLEVLTK